MVKPLLYRMMNCSRRSLTLVLPMGQDYRRRSVDRLALVPVRISDEGSVIPVDFHGSAHISALNEADGIIFIPSGVRELGKGDMVSVRQI